jgi:hypothetical protein
LLITLWCQRALHTAIRPSLKEQVDLFINGHNDFDHLFNVNLDDVDVDVNESFIDSVTVHGIITHPTDFFLPILPEDNRIAIFYALSYSEKIIRKDIGVYSFKTDLLETIDDEDSNVQNNNNDNDEYIFVEGDDDIQFTDFTRTTNVSLNRIPHWLFSVVKGGFQDVSTDIFFPNLHIKQKKGKNTLVINIF